METPGGLRWSSSATAAIAGSGIALAGVGFVCLTRAGVPVSGSAGIMVAAMLVQGIYHPLQRPLLLRYTNLEVACYAMVAGTAMTLPLVPFGLARLLGAGTAAWLAAAYLGLLPSALGFILWGYAVARLPVAVSTSLLYLVPPIAVLISWTWLGELPTPIELLGGLVVMVGVVTTRGRRSPSPAVSPAGLGRLRATSASAVSTATTSTPAERKAPDESKRASRRERVSGGA